MTYVFLTLILILASSVTAFPQAQSQQPPEEPPSVLTVPRDYRYDARGRRDPFVNPVPKPRAEARTVAPAVVRPPGLRGVAVSEAQITGVVTSKEPSMNVVIIAAPGARTPYFARVGSQLYDGVVKAITLDSVTFTVTGPAGETKTPRDIVRRVRPNPGDDR